MLSREAAEELAKSIERDRVAGHHPLFQCIAEAFLAVQDETAREIADALEPLKGSGDRKMVPGCIVFSAPFFDRVIDAARGGKGE